MNSGEHEIKYIETTLQKPICNLKPDIQAKFVAAFTVHLVLQRHSLTSVLSISELIREPAG